MKTAYFNGFSLELPEEAVMDCSHAGRCDDDVTRWHGYIDFSHISVTQLKKELYEYGAWTDEELEDRRENEERLLWIAAGNLKEEQEEVRGMSKYRYQTRRWLDVSEMEYINSRHGKFFFASETMKFFKSKVYGVVKARIKVRLDNWRTLPVSGKAVFITSEKCDNETRLYTVRLFNVKTGAVDTVGEFQQYRTLRAARRAASQVEV